MAEKKLRSKGLILGHYLSESCC